MHKSKILALLLAVAMVVSMVVVPAYAAGEYAFKLTAESKTVATGAEVTVEITVENMPDNIAGVGLELTYPDGWTLKSAQNKASSLNDTFSDYPINTALNPLIIGLDNMDPNAVGNATYSGAVTTCVFVAPAEGGAGEFKLEVTSSDVFENWVPVEVLPAVEGITITVTDGGSTEPATCSLCGETVETWTSWNGTDALAGGHYILDAAADSVTMSAALTINAETCIDLNNKTLVAGSGKQAFLVKGTLRVKDGTVQGSGNSYVGHGGLINVASGNDLTMNNVTLTGGISNNTSTSSTTARRGGNLYIVGSSTVTLTDCTISNGKSNNRGGNIWAGAGTTLNLINTDVTGGSIVKHADNSTLETGTSSGTRAGNIYVEGSTSVPSYINIYGDSEISGAKGAPASYRNIAWYRNAHLNMYGGVINGASQTMEASTCTSTVYNGTVTSSYGSWAAKKAACACVVESGTTYTFWQPHLNAENYCATCDQTYTNPCVGEHSPVADETVDSGWICDVCGTEVIVSNVETRDCPYHGADQEYLPWDGQSASGHYYLSDDVSLDAMVSIAAGDDVCIDLAGNTITAPSANAAFSVSGTLTIVDTDAQNQGTIQGNGTCSVSGGVIRIASGGTFYLYDGTVAGGKTANYGGNIYNEGTFKMASGGVVTGGESKNHGGNIYCSWHTDLDIAGGLITLGKSGVEGTTISYGGNICVADGETGTDTTASIRNATITYGEALHGSGGNVMILNYIAEGDATIDGCTIYGGTSTSSARDLFVAQSSYVTVTNTTIGNAAFDAAQENGNIGVRTNTTQYYRIKIGAGNVITQDPTNYLTCEAAAFNGETYKTFGGQTALTEAQTYATADGSVTLGKDVTVDGDLILDVAELNLNGKKLTVGGTLDATLTDLVDNTGNASIEAEVVMAEGTKSSLPLTDAEGITTLVKPTSTKKGSKNNTTAGETKVFAFYLGDVAGEEVHAAILAGDVELAVMLKNGDVTVGTYYISEGTMAAYAADWQNMAIKLTVTGAADMDLSFEVVCISNDAEYVTAETPVA